MKTLDEVIKAYELCLDKHIRCNECPFWEEGCPESRKKDALHYLQAYQQLSGALISDNTVMTEDGIYCKVCGTRLDKDWDDETAD